MTRPAALLAVTATAALAAACTSKATTTATSSASSASKVSINADDKSCSVSTQTLSAGRYSVAVANNGNQITEVYIYAPGDQIVGEVENVGPATKRNLIVELPAGSYEVACKPGMSGTGIRATLTVSGQVASPTSASAELVTAVSSYRRYVIAETDALTQATTAFVAAVKAGDVTRAKARYSTARTHYERIEPIAESFGDLDPLVDMRAADIDATHPFVGFHRLEKDLWVARSVTGDTAIADALLTNVKKLTSLVTSVSITPITMGNGAKSLLDEVAKSKVTGEEEFYSRVDLVDFDANVEGSQQAYTALRPFLISRNPTLVKTLDARFRTMLAQLDKHRGQLGKPGYVPGSPFVSYDALTKDQVKALAVEVDSISEPLGQISGIVGSS